MNEELTFGSWLRQRRATLGVTQDQFARRLGFSPAMMRKLESGERRPSGQIATLLADYFRIPADEREAFITFARSERTASPGQAATDAGAPWRVVRQLPSNLPAMLTHLIGREVELAKVKELILNSRVRLLTLTGPPGIGKTRLALQAASDLSEQFEEGVYFVDLASVSDPDEVLPTAARALGLPESREHPLADALIAHVRGKRMLLLLDNFEQVLDAALDVVRLLQSSPRLKALVTSREALHVRGERRYPVPPLQVPSSKFQVHGHSEQPGTLNLELGTIPAVQLFVERAQAVAFDFELLAANAEDVAAVCAGLEGLPLAIELVAARAGHLSPREMRTELVRRLELSTGGARDLPARHRTLYAAIEWSYNLLAEAERRLFRRLGVFVGGFTADAVQEVAANDAVANMLISLVDKHLVKEERTSGEAGGVRFGMLETIRDYALKQLAQYEGDNGEDEAGITQRRHATYFAEWTERVDPELKGPDQVMWLAELDNEHSNIRSALEWSSEFAPEVTARMMFSLRRYWHIRGHGHFRESSAWVDRMLVKVGDMPALTRAKAWRVASQSAAYRGDPEMVMSRLEQSVASARLAGDKALISDGLGEIGYMLLERGDYARAKALFEQCLVLDRELRNTYGVCWVLTALGEVARSEEDYAQARLYYEEGLALAREIENKYNMAHLLGNLGWVALAEERYEDAQRFVGESLALMRELGHEVGMVTCLARFAAISTAMGQPYRAAVLSEAVEQLLDAINGTLEQTDRRVYERYLAVAREQVEEEAFKQAWEEGRAMSVEQAVAYALEERGE